MIPDLTHLSPRERADHVMVEAAGASPLQTFFEVSQ